MARASSTAMDALHGTMARLLTDELVRAGKAASAPRFTTRTNDEGNEERVPNPDYIPLNPQLLDKALKFLKDNGIDSPEKSKAIHDLSVALDDLNLDYLETRQ